MPNRIVATYLASPEFVRAVLALLAVLVFVGIVGAVVRLRRRRREDRPLQSWKREWANYCRERDREDSTAH